jgi:hypothetical protein
MTAERSIALCGRSCRDLFEQLCSAWPSTDQAITDRYESNVSSGKSSPGLPQRDESRYSCDYRFTTAFPDEAMHGQAVALFDFQRANENELPLVEGQVIWVSYRHSPGWLVAEDTKTHESGLVPEEYVRLLRDIQGGLHSLTGQVDVFSPGGADSGTPTQAKHGQPASHVSTASDESSSNAYQHPILSTFSTSSKDLHPYPQHLLKTQAGMAPPQIALSAIKTESGRFDLWANNIAALQDAYLPTSLEYRIREDSNARSVIKKALAYLEESLQLGKLPFILGWDAAPL